MTLNISKKLRLTCQVFSDYNGVELALKDFNKLEHVLGLLHFSKQRKRCIFKAEKSGNV
jgi:hypothetical protein